MAYDRDDDLASSPEAKSNRISVAALLQDCCDEIHGGPTCRKR